MTPIEQFTHDLRTAQANARRLRCESFVRYAPVICGLRLSPLTLERYNYLIAFESPFVVGGPIALDDLCLFVWVLHPHFGQFAERERRAVYAAILRALQAPTPHRTGLARLWLPVLQRRRGLRAWLLRKWCQRYHANPTADELFATAVEAAQQLVVNALADWPKSDDEATTPPAPFALQAQFLNLLARHLHQPFSEIRAMPLAEFAQHLREVMHHLSEGKASLLTPAEARAYHALLGALNQSSQVSDLNPQVSKS